MSDTVLTRYSRSISAFHSPLRHPPSERQARADALVSSFIDHATDGYSLAAMVGGGLVYRLGRIGTLALGSRLVGAYDRTPLHLLIRPVSVGVGFTGEVLTFEAGQRALRVGIGGADPNLLRWSGENGLGRGLVGAAITLGSLKGAGAFVNGQNPVLQHLFQDSAIVLAHNVSDRIFSGRGTLQRAPTLAEQFVEAEATLWQMNAGMALVHGAFPTLGQMERSLDLGIRSQVGAIPSQLPAGRREAPLQFNQPFPKGPLWGPATAGEGILSMASGEIEGRGPHTMAMATAALNGRRPGGERSGEPNDFLGEAGRDLLTTFNEGLKARGFEEIAENQALNVQALFRKLEAFTSLRYGFDVLKKARAFREFLAERIRALQLFSSFLVRGENGTYELRPPGELADRGLPPIFHFEGIAERAIPIVIGNNRSPGWIYVRAGDLKIIQDVVSRERLRRYEGQVEKALMGPHPPAVFLSLNQGDYHLDNGHHRALLVSRFYGEHFYILARTAPSRSTAVIGRPLKDLKEIGEEEFLALCRDDEEADPNFSDIVSGGFW